MFVVAFIWAIKHKFIMFCNCFKLKDDIKVILAIFIPAMLTNIATPIGTWYIMKSISEYWDDVVAAMAVLWRLTPILFVYIFGMSWAIGSIIWQNFWAKNYCRVHEIIKKSILIATYYIIWAITLLIITHNFIIDIFGIKWDWIELFKFYTYFLSIFFIFNAILFIWNAAFNVIWKAYLSTITNILKSIIFLIPFVYLLWNNFGMKGVLFAESLALLLTWVFTLILLKKYLPKNESVSS
jgi:Na+-driven multidrug efflux pump